jgi:hypothetical protein
MAARPKVSLSAERAELRALLAQDATGEWSDDAGDGSIGSIVAVKDFSAIGQVMQRGPVRREEDLVERRRLTRQIAMLHNLAPGVFSQLDGLRNVLVETRRLLATMLESTEATLQAGDGSWAQKSARLTERRRLKQTIDLIDYAMREET